MQYPNIAQPQYGFAPTMPSGIYAPPTGVMNFKKGGGVEERRTYGLENAAEMIRQRGRNGDTILAHINPQEAGILKLLGGSGTINPHTGLPEFGFFKSIAKPFKSAAKEVKRFGSKVGKELERGVESIAQNKYLGPIAQMASYLHPVSAALYAGLAPEGSSFDVKGAAKAAAMQQIGEAIYDYANAPTGTEGGGGGIDVTDGGGGFDLGQTPPPPNPSVVEAVRYPDVGEIPGVTSMPGATPPPQPSFIDRATSYVSDIPSKVETGIKSLTETVSNLPDRALEYASEIPGKVLNYASELPGKALNYAIENPIPTALAGTAIYGQIKSIEELEKQREEAEKILAEQEGKKASDIAWAQGVLRDYPINYRRLTAEDVRAQQGMAGGGLASLNAFKSGGKPRFLKGGGDGMSDDIPATIGGRQKAALSDGEFVIPADVVSHLGNGSSRAGAKKLYKMMDNIRQARTGKERQAPEVKADRYMPA